MNCVLKAVSFCSMFIILGCTSQFRSLEATSSSLIGTGDSGLQISEKKRPQPTAQQVQVLPLTNATLSGVPGQSLTLTTQFNAVPLSINYSVLVHFIRADGSKAFAADYSPMPATTVWSGLVQNSKTFTIPADLPAGTYSIRVGLFEPVDPWTNRLRLLAGPGVIEDNELRYTVGTLNVSAVLTPLLSPAGQDPSKFNLVFQDEFNSFDTTKWWDHWWYQTSNPTKNYAFENGALYIWPQRDATGNFFPRDFLTRGKYETTYGYFEMEAKLPFGKGTWPAFWLYADPVDARPEIDIMEAYASAGLQWADANYHPINYSMTLHQANADYSWHQVAFFASLTDFSPKIDLSAGFHKYAVNWEPSGITFYFDGKPMGAKWMDSSNYYNRPMYILLDLAYSKDADGVPDNSTPQGQGNSFIINYVRVWKAK